MAKKTDTVKTEVLTQASALVNYLSTNDTIQLIPLDKLVIDKSFNVRDKEAYSASDLEEMVADLVERGQIEPATVESLPNGSYKLIRGHRRASALTIAKERGLVCKATGKPFEGLLAYVKVGLTDLDRIVLLLDEGQRKGLNAAELHRAFERAFDAQMTEEATVTLLAGPIDAVHPPKKRIDASAEDYSKKLLAYRKGVLQTAKSAWQAPLVLRDAYMERLHGVQSWPRNAELFQLVKIFKDERDKDRTNKITRKNPGPEFMKAYNELVEKQAQAEALGQRAKSSAMMNAQQVRDTKAQANSVILKTAMDLVLRQLPAEAFVLIDGLLSEAEKSSPELINALTEIINQFVTAPVAEEVAV